MSRKPLHADFKDYTLSELNEIKKDVCIAHKCPYLSKAPWVHKTKKAATSNFATTLCDYILRTGHARGYMPDVCEHWKDKNVKKRNFANGDNL